MQDNYGWFDSINPNPCNWSFITCNNNDRIIALGDFEYINYDYNTNQIINTTYWPEMIVSVTFRSSYIQGELDLRHLPPTTQRFDISYAQGLFLNLTAFPDMSQLSNMTYLRIFCTYPYLMYGTVENLGVKFPPNLEHLSLRYFTMNKFPDLSQLNNLTYLYFGEVNIKNKYSFVSSQLPSQLQYIHIYDAQLKGTLNFTRLLADSDENIVNGTLTISNLSVSNLKWAELSSNDFDSVDFRGLPDDATVLLDRFVPCAAQSLYSGEEEYICTTRHRYYCTGESECLDTCECFKLPDDWEPGLNDFYTYVNCVDEILICIPIILHCQLTLMHT